MNYIHFIGIDVSKEYFDVALHAKAAKPQRFPNSSEGFAAFACSLEAVLAQSFVVLEATGGYETALAAFLLARKAALHRADPLTAKHFIRSCRLHGKTDALDAAALARYACERHASLTLCRPNDAAQAELELLLARRADLVASRVAENNRLKHPRYTPLQQMIKEMIAAINAQIATLESRIEALIAQSQALKAKLNVMTAIKGVGRQTAYTLLACMPELGTLTRRQAASLAGCAPHPKDSGKNAGYRKTTGGRAIVKRALFMAAMSARSFNPILKKFYENLIKNGKKPMVALTAIMRKIIIVINAKIRDENYAISW